MKKEIIDIVQKEEVSDIIVNIAEFIDEDDWEYVFTRLLEVASVSYLKGMHDCKKILAKRL